MWFSRRERTSIRISNLFGKFLSNEAARSLANPETMWPPPLLREEVGYILLQVCDDTAEEVRRHLPRVLDLIIDEGGMIESIMSSHVSASFDHRSSTSLQQMKTLATKFGPDVRSIYTYGEFLRGNFGSQGRFVYGTIIPNLGEMLEQLHQLEFGAATEFMMA